MLQNASRGTDSLPFTRSETYPKTYFDPETIIKDNPGIIIAHKPTPVLELISNSHTSFFTWSWGCAGPLKAHDQIPTPLLI